MIITFSFWSAFQIIGAGNFVDFGIGFSQINPPSSPGGEYIYFARHRGRR